MLGCAAGLMRRFELGEEPMEVERLTEFGLGRILLCELLASAPRRAGCRALSRDARSWGRYATGSGSVRRPGRSRPGLGRSRRDEGRPPSRAFRRPAVPRAPLRPLEERSAGDASMTLRGPGPVSSGRRRGSPGSRPRSRLPVPTALLAGSGEAASRPSDPLAALLVL